MDRASMIRSELYDPTGEWDSEKSLPFIILEPLAQRRKYKSYMLLVSVDFILKVDTDCKMMESFGRLDREIGMLQRPTRLFFVYRSMAAMYQDS